METLQLRRYYHLLKNYLTDHRNSERNVKLMIISKNGSFIDVIHKYGYEI